MGVPVSGFQNLFLQAAYTASGSVPLFISPGAQPTGNVPLYLKTQISCAWERTTELWESWITPWGSGCLGATAVTTGSVNLTISGNLSPSFSGNFPMFIPVFETTGNASGTMPLYLSAGNITTGTIPMYMQVVPAATGTVPLFLKGGSASNPKAVGIISGSVDLFISGASVIQFTGTTPLYIQGPSTGVSTGQIPLFLIGRGSGQNGNISLFIFSADTTGVMPLFIKGFWLDEGQIQNIRGANSPFNPSWRSGAIPITGTMPFYIPLQSDIDDNMPLYISGALQATGSMNLFASGALISSGGIPLYMAPASGFSDDNITLYIHGTFVVGGPT